MRSVNAQVVMRIAGNALGDLLCCNSVPQCTLESFRVVGCRRRRRHSHRRRQLCVKAILSDIIVEKKRVAANVSNASESRIERPRKRGQ